MKKSYLLIFSLCFFVLFAVLSKFEDRLALRNLDVAVTVKVQEKIDNSSHLRTKVFVDNLMEGATFIASPLFSVFVVVLLAFLAKKRWFVILILFALLVGGEIVGKSVVHHPSPPFSMIKHTTSVFPANYVNEQFSYPSGHVARAVFIALVSYCVLRIRYQNKWKKLLLVLGLLGYVLLVGTSRIYLGHHWFSDVMGGVLLGSALGVLTWASMATYNTHTMSD